MTADEDDSMGAIPSKESCLLAASWRQRTRTSERGFRVGELLLVREAASAREIVLKQRGLIPFGNLPLPDWITNKCTRHPRPDCFR